MILGTLARRIRLGLKSLLLHKLRSALATLGIIFGVSSVIAMLAIGEGASYEQQKMFQELGATNLIFRSVKPPTKEAVSAQTSSGLAYGLTRADLARIRQMPTVVQTVAQRELESEIRCQTRRLDGRVVGTTPDYADFYKIRLTEGRFLSAQDGELRRPVAVLGATAARKLFPLGDALGRTVRLKSDYYRVIGVLAERASHTIAGPTKLTQDFDRDLYIPLATFTERFGDVLVRVARGSQQIERVQLHQITARVGRIEDVLATADAIRHMLEHFHPDLDYLDVVPLQLLRQAEHTRRIFITVLGSIAGISLLVGGIGIMNIMLATVTERTREIGIRRAVGAKRRDITAQFVIETVVLSGTGGLLGLALGVIIPAIVTQAFGMPTIVTGWSLGLALGISGLVGVIFGLYPARRAAMMDPIEALRHE